MGRPKIHGMDATPTCLSWRSIINRCYNSKQESYLRYGGMGIKCCEFIRASPVNLVILIGLRPDTDTIKYSIDRIKNEHGYYCGRCAECLANGWPPNIKWSTSSEQAKNRKTTRIVEINGIKKCSAEWADPIGIKRGTFHWRVQHGWTGDKLLTPCSRLDT